MRKANECRCSLSPLALGLSFGIIWGLSVLITGLLAYYLSYGTHFVVAMSSMYVGYEPSIPGSLIGGAFGFVDGLIGGVLVGWIYNLFLNGCNCCGTTTCETTHVDHRVADHRVTATKPTKKVVKKPATTTAKKVTKK